MDASPFYFGTKSQDYVNTHPITLHYIGPGVRYDYIFDYAPDADFGIVMSEEGKLDDYDHPAFKEKYGIDFSIWGNEQTSITVDDFVDYASMAPNVIRWRFGVLYADNSELFGYDNVSFEGHDGSICFFLDVNRAINCIGWTCYEYSEETFEELKEKLSSLGTYAWTQELDRGRTEVGYNIQGRVIFASIQDNGPNEQYVYVFACYDERNGQ